MELTTPPAGLDPDRGVFLVPKGDGSGTFALEVGTLLRAEGRLADVAIVNHQTAPELLHTFSEFYNAVAAMVGRLRTEETFAREALRRAQATALLSLTDEAVEARGFKRASADIRKAMVELDPVVIAAQDRLSAIGAAKAWSETKRQKFQDAYMSVRKYTGTLIGSTIGPTPMRAGPDGPQKPAIPGFGKARY